MSTSVRRLFEQFQPENYKLEISIDHVAQTFTGNVAIRGKKVGRPSQRITLHQKGLTITKATVAKLDKQDNEQPLEIARTNNQDSYDEVRLHTKDMIYPGSYHVYLEFSGKLTKPMNGIYPCFFKQDGEQKQLIATQFESHHAREAFPCIDEPEAKATFDLALTVPKSMSKTVLANTPAHKPTVEGDLITTIFDTTPRMSTYLLAFAYGDMDYLEATTKAGVTVRTYATPDNVKYTEFALDVAVKCLDFYNSYFGIDYPLAKCDFVALPDFASGAMENWGLITFREQAMLMDPENTSLSMKQYIANVVAHELTHQWFGNLVTMKWWNDLWLNESFASWMSYLAVDELFPEWQVWTQFVVDEQAPALKLDALEHTHPISVAINHPDEIRTIFDAISYEKGASVLNMLRSYIGADDFRDGLRIYLKKHAYSNTTSADLWAAWEEASGKPVGEFMTTWTTQAGYPIVSASIDGVEETIKQERFYLNPTANKETAVWPVPLSPNDGMTIKQTLTSATFNEPFDEDSFSILNEDRSSFCRVVYDSVWLAKIAKHINDLPETVRLGVLSDSFEAAKGGNSSTVDALKLLESYKDEDNTVVWDIIAGNLGNLKLVMNDDEVRDHMKPYIRTLVAKQVQRLGWEARKNDSHFDLLLRPTVIALAAAADEQAVVDEALRQFTAMTKPEDVHPDMRGIVYGIAARLGGQAEFDKMWRMHNQSANSEERVTLSAALTGFEHPEQITQALEKVKTDDVRLQDSMYWIAYSFGNRFARKQTWQWLQDNWQWLKENNGDDLSFYRMPTYAARVQSDASFLPEFEAFFNQHLSPAFERPIKQGIETIQWQSAWRDRDLQAVRDYFKNYK
jgi:aminopeptidase N